ncbi:hypothetical protein RhiXN_09242 [Rhizoctonia solani]|uniref:Uncharacterized protein n=1 Tax=Rhizoctonia solani TaxID=456999 RepID=A0A8H8NYA5_9AGAM|nr:uncharacterized protein RhiXN_09242 [Rhizoctonia solani]QRW20267.1 hypothetical protein RhiXN_09242 [Rhizoctonia solani]
MSWFKKKKVNPEDGDFPHVPKHYREHERKTQLTQPIKPAPVLRWNGDGTVVWGIDVGPRVTAVAIDQSVEVHNIVYWPKVFPLRQSTAPGEPLPEVKEKKSYKIREVHEVTEFVSHPAWSSEKTTNYVHVIGATNSPSAFQVRTELPFIEVPNERYKYVDLVEHLLKHALSVYGAVVKPGQPQWSRGSDVVVSLPSGISRSAEISVTDALNHMIQDIMPKVIGDTHVYYVPRPDLRLFEDDTWRNIDTSFQPNDTFMVVDWDLTSGDMICASFMARCLPSGQIAFDSQQRSYLQSTPATRKRDSSTDEQEGTRFANALHWAAEHKHNVKAGVRLADTTETGAFGAVMWRIAHAIASGDPSNGDNFQLVRDAMVLPLTRASESGLQPLESKSGEKSPTSPAAYSDQNAKSISTTEPSATFVSTSPPSPPPAIHSVTSATHNSYLSTGQVEIIPHTPDTIAGTSTIPDSLDDEAPASAVPPPAYTDNGGDTPRTQPPEKGRR